MSNGRLFVESTALTKQLHRFQLARLAVEDPTKADFVKIRFFTGLSIDQAAATLKESTC